MADTMAKYGVRGSVSLNVAVCDHYPEVIERCCELGWELFSHGTYNTRYFYDMSEDMQRELIRDSRETILRASGQRLDGWLTPAISNDETTQHVLAEEGILYTLDMTHDDQPTPVNTRAGRLVSIPYSLEVNDVPLFVSRNTPAERYVAICKAQFDQLYEEGAESGTVMCMPLHPYLIGQPHRIAALDAVLAHITCARQGVARDGPRDRAALHRPPPRCAPILDRGGHAMTGLPADYAEYPIRKRAMDHDRYPYRILPRTAPVTWPGGARVALWVAVHAGWFPMDMPLKPFIAPGGMERPYPSYWDFTQRDYGNRIGIYRMMKAMAARGVKGTALLSAALAREYPVLMDDVAAAGWEPACAGLDMGHLHHGGVAEAEERAWIAEAAALLRGRFGDTVTGWHSPAHSESWRTPDLVAGAGFTWTSGWANDDMPYAFATDAGTLIGHAAAAGPVGPAHAAAAAHGDRGLHRRHPRRPCDAGCRGTGDRRRPHPDPGGDAMADGPAAPHPRLRRDAGCHPRPRRGLERDGRRDRHRLAGAASLGRAAP